MFKVVKLFMDVKKEQEWLAQQKGWKLIATNGFLYKFEKSPSDYEYEYIFFEKNKKELHQIRQQITDSDIEFVCHSSTWALFRKDVTKGEIHVFSDNFIKYKTLMKKYNTYVALGACYMCLGTSQMALVTTLNGLFGFSSALFYLSSSIFFITSSYIKKYALEYDDGTYADRMKREK